MKLIATDQSGWAQLYYDEATDTYLEKTYPNSEVHGGGDPEWQPLSKEDAFAKYAVK